MTVIEWLKTPDGESWSAQQHIGSENEGGNPARFSHGIFATIKYDHECCWNGTEYVDCEPFHGYKWLDSIIKNDIERFGMNGLAA